MQNEKKLTKEDTWRAADLRKYIKERDGDERKHRRGESSERRQRDPDKESRRDRDKLRERESTRERRDQDERHRHADRRKEGSKDRRSDRVRTEERDGEKRERDKLPEEKLHHHKEDREKRREAEAASRHGERDADRHRDKEREREKEKERRRAHNSNDDKRREERDRDRRREERDRGHAAERERQRQRERGDGDRDRDRAERHERERRERHREEHDDSRDDKERRERREEKRHLDVKERDHKEEHSRHRDEKERRHKERRHHDEKREPRRDSGDHRDVKGEEDVGRRRGGDRERDERRERAQVAEAEPARNHRRETTKKSESEKSHRQEAKAEDAAAEHHTVVAEAGGITEEAVVSDEAYQEYEDDFEDYEEDFEETDESTKDSGDEREQQQTDEDGEGEEPKTQRRKEIEAIQKAMNEENQRVGTTQTVLDRRRDDDDDDDGRKLSRESESRGSQRGKFIDFVAAKQREVSKHAASKQKKRSAELLRLIELDYSTTFSILDLPPVNEYDMYIKNFGSANTKQAYVQCNEDNADRDVQTEEVETCEKWTQHPPESGGACGDPNVSQEARDKLLGDTGFDSQRLVAFLRSTSQVMMVLLEEEQAERKSQWKPRSQSQNLSFSDGSLQLNTRLPFLYGRSVNLVHFSQVQRFTMMSVHSPTAKPSAVRLDSCTVICIWNIWEPSRPQKVLVYESDVQCCCFSPGKATLVFAGTSVGSVLLWDLREQASIHYRLMIGQEEWTFRQPTFSTDAVMANSGHQSPVTSVEVVPSAAGGGDELESPLLASEEESSGSSFQLASLDETGILNFWVVIELPKANQAGSPTDLGLRPGGKVKLLHSSSLLAAERPARDAAKMATLQTLHLRFLPTDSSHFFIGTNMGLVNHGTSHGLKAPPKFYRCREAGARPVQVTSVHFSPFKPQVFLVGCVDGSIRLHAVSSEQPVAEWHHPAAVVSLQWSQTRAAVFCMLDAASKLHVWDLSRSDTEPVVTETVDSDRVTGMAVFGDSGQHNTYAGVALARQSGTIDLQYFPKQLASASAAEVETLERMMAEAS